jgi:predicted metal-dependent HD superfamily phosphohydrolase
MDDRTFMNCLDHASKGQGVELLALLDAAYAGRPYHNLEHVKRMLDFCEPALIEMDNPEAFVLAVAFHDLIYVAGAKDNELKSAEAAVEWMRTHRIQFEKGQQEVWELIMATMGHKIQEGDPLYFEKSWIIDADLIGFVRDWERNAELIREEFSFIPEDEWRAGRTGFLEAFAKREPFYYVPAHEAEFGAQAKANIRSEIEDLS